jgi:hypothetical protein
LFGFFWIKGLQHGTGVQLQVRNRRNEQEKKKKKNVCPAIESLKKCGVAKMVS